MKMKNLLAIFLLAVFIFLVLPVFIDTISTLLTGSNLPDYAIIIIWGLAAIIIISPFVMD